MPKESYKLHTASFFKLEFNGGAVMVVIVWYLHFQLPVQSVPITTNVLSSSPTQTRYNIM